MQPNEIKTRLQIIIKKLLHMWLSPRNRWHTSTDQ